MVRRRSTVRFRNGAPGNRINSNASNRSWGPFRGPSQLLAVQLSVGFRPAEELGSRSGSVMDQLDCTENHRRGVIDLTG